MTAILRHLQPEGGVADAAGGLGDFGRGAGEGAAVAQSHQPVVDAFGRTAAFRGGMHDPPRPVGLAHRGAGVRADLQRRFEFRNGLATVFEVAGPTTSVRYSPK